MKTHLLFAALLLLVLATQAARLAADAAAPPEPDLAAEAAAIGLRPAGESPDGLRLAAAPGCPQPVALATPTFDGLGAPDLRALRARGGPLKVVYLHQVTAAPHLLPLVARWAAASLRHTLGLRRAAVPRHYVVAALPPGCPALDGLDWARLSP